jgi:hypothetical protein
MRKFVLHVRDLDLIENELKNNPAGVFALGLENEKIAQIATTFLYLDKNIYIFFSEEDEFYNSIQFDADVTFTILRYGNIGKSKDVDFDPSYNLFSISVKGIVKKVEEAKVIEELRKNYISKYQKSAEGKIDYSILAKAVLIDTEEIQAVEETGG